MSKIIRVRYEKGVLKPLDSVDFKEGKELPVKIVSLASLLRVPPGT